MTTLGSLARDGVLEFSDGYRTRRDQHSAEGFRILRAGDVRDGRIQPDGPDSVGTGYAEMIGAKEARTGDVVLTTKGTVGRTGIVLELRESVVYSPQVCFFRTRRSDVLDARFLYHWLSSPEFVEQSGYLKSATDMAPYISLKDLASTRISLPPVPTQRAIAEVLGALDDKIAANVRVGSSAEVVAQARYDQATAGAERLPSSALLSPMLGGTPARSIDQYWGGTIPWVSVKDVTRAVGGVVLATDERITEAGVQASRAKPVEAGSVILTARGTVGVVARLGVAAAFNQSCYAFSPTAEVPASVLYFLARDAARQALSVAHGSVFSTITLRSFDALLVPRLEPKVVRRLESELGPLLDRVVIAGVESRKLAELRDTLLPHLMSGRVAVREAEQRVEGVL